MGKAPLGWPQLQFFPMACCTRPGPSTPPPWARKVWREREAKVPSALAPRNFRNSQEHASGARASPGLCPSHRWSCSLPPAPHSTLQSSCSAQKGWGWGGKGHGRALARMAQSTGRQAPSLSLWLPRARTVAPGPEKSRTVVRLETLPAGQERGRGHRGTGPSVLREMTGLVRAGARAYHLLVNRGNAEPGCVEAPRKGGHGGEQAGPTPR